MPGRWETDRIIDTQVASGGNFFGTSRVQRAQGADVAAANDLTLGLDGNTFAVTGTTTINRINIDGWSGGSEVCLKFTADCVVTHNYFDYASGSFYPILLDGGRDWHVTGGYEGRRGSALLLRLIAANYFIFWQEIGRSDPRAEYAAYSPLVDPSGDFIFDPTGDVIVGPD